MKNLAALGLGALLCLPCLAVIAGFSLAAFGGALATLAASPAVQATGVLIAIGGLAAAGSYLKRRRACQCEIERSEGGEVTIVRHEAHM